MIIVRHLANRLIGLPRYAKQLLVMSVDSTLCLASVCASFYLRLGELKEISNQITDPVLVTCAVSVCLAIPIFAGTA